MFVHHYYYSAQVAQHTHSQMCVCGKYANAICPVGSLPLGYLIVMAWPLGCPLSPNSNCAYLLLRAPTTSKSKSKKRRPTTLAPPNNGRDNNDTTARCVRCGQQVHLNSVALCTCCRFGCFWLLLALVLLLVLLLVVAAVQSDRPN